MTPKMKRPEPGWTTKCKVIHVFDGDTITIEMTRTVRVRLIDVWAPEVRTRNQREKKRGITAAQYLNKLANGKTGTLFVPVGTKSMSKLWTFGRILGHVWVEGKSSSLNEMMIESGHATKTKRRTKTKPKPKALII